MIRIRLWPSLILAGSAKTAGPLSDFWGSKSLVLAENSDAVSLSLLSWLGRCIDLSLSNKLSEVRLFNSHTPCFKPWCSQSVFCNCESQRIHWPFQPANFESFSLDQCLYLKAFRFLCQWFQSDCFYCLILHLKAPHSDR